MATDFALLSDLAEDWLTGLRLGGSRGSRSESSAGTISNVERARRGDLKNWALSLHAALGRTPTQGETLGAVTFGGLTAEDLTSECLIEAFRHLQRNRAPSTIKRHLSTLRGFCRWLTTRGHLSTDPTLDDHLAYRTVVELEVRAFTPHDVKAMIDVAATPLPRVRSAWPTRDQAIVDFLASTGVRAAEACALQLRDVAQGEDPLVLVRRATKSGRSRSIPLPHRVLGRLDYYLTERDRRATEESAFATEDRRSPLFVRNNGAAFSTDALYHLIRRLAHQAATTVPENALIHAFRHHYGLQLALRRVPVPTIQQLMGHADPRTTSIYTRHAPQDLITALDDAGWLGEGLVDVQKRSRAMGNT